MKKKAEDGNPLLSSNNNQGSISWSVVKLWVRGGGGIITMIALLCVFAIATGSTAFSSWWLKQWFRTPSFPPLVMLR
jgi:hypothetical protein